MSNTFTLSAFILLKMKCARQMTGSFKIGDFFKTLTHHISELEATFRVLLIYRWKGS